MMAMSYRKELRLDINPKAFSTTQAKSARRSSKPSADLQLALTYVPEISRGVKSGSNIAPPAEKGLLLHALRARLSQVAPGATSQPKALLASISKTWDTACSLQNEIRLLEYCGVTRRKMTESKQSEPTPLIVRCILLGRLPTTKTEEGEREAENSSPSRLDIDFTVKPRLWADDGTSQSSNTDIDIDVDISVCKVYGFQHDAEHSARFSEAKIRDYLHKVIQSSPGVQFGNGLWLDAVKSLEKKLFMQ
jgi:kinetochore protein Spc7/SPC105